MKASVYTKYGSPEVLQIKDVPKPVPQDDEVLIQVHASTVNRTDCGFLSGKPLIARLATGLFRPKNKTLGNEFAGQIEATGKNITSFKAGDHVFGFNSVKFGAHAEYLAMKEATNSVMARIPEGMAYEAAAPVCEGAHYALCNIRAAKIKKGHRVLVNGATGAIGSAAVQLLKHFGATVTAVCNTKNTALVKSLGADEIIDHMKEDFTRLDQSFDMVFDAVGKSTFRKCKPVLKQKGIYISTEPGFMAQNIFLAILTPLFKGKQVLFPIPSIEKDIIAFLKDLVEKGQYKPVIDKHYPFDQIKEAFHYVQTGQKTGNVVLKISEKDA